MSIATQDQIFVSWTQQWDLDFYIEHYLRTRRIKATDDVRHSVRQCMQSYPGRPPHMKSDVDYFLDANLTRHYALR